MREIKFRAWSNSDKQLTYFDLHSLTGIYNDIWDYIDETTILQYTGLKDKNGKEIYEGDIVKDEEEIRTIIFRDGCFIAAKNWTEIEGTNLSGCFWEGKELSRYFRNDLEVIGNIHENPGLLK